MFSRLSVEIMEVLKAAQKHIKELYKELMKVIPEPEDDAEFKIENISRNIIIE